MNKIPTLIVDDEHADRYILKRQLKELSFVSQIFEKGNGKEALDFLQDYPKQKETHGDDFPPLVIFLDINMPLVNGFEFLEKFQELRQSQSNFGSCVIMMFTSSESENDRSKAFSFEFVKDYIYKGDTDSEKLAEKIGRITSGG